MDANTIIFIVLIIVVLLVAMFIVPQWRLRRAIRQVIRIFRENNAVDARTAKTVQELGLGPRSMIEGLFRGRDYKQYALTALMKNDIINMTEGGRLYISEDKLRDSGLDKGSAPYYR